MANNIIGKNGSIGAGSTPNTDDSQPHWKTATTTPYADAIDNTFINTAFNGTSTERNTMVSNKNDTPSTAPKNTRMRPDR